MDKTLRRVLAAVVVVVLTYAGTSLEPEIRRVTGIAVGLFSLLLLVISRVHLGKSFSVKATAKALVTSGLYSRIEHPLYSFLDLLLAALIVFFGMPVLLVPWGVLVVIHLFECRREERILAAAFGAEYEAYRSRTWL